MNPKVFISYSWHPEENKIRVEQLARRLMSDGIDVTLDVWSLKDGQDKYVFMEKMVTDTEINKVLIICNQDYAEKRKLTAEKVELVRRVPSCLTKSIRRPIRLSSFLLFLKREMMERFISLIS